MYLKLCSRHQDIVVYLKSPRRRREKILYNKRTVNVHNDIVQVCGAMVFRNTLRGGGAERAAHTGFVLKAVRRDGL